VTSLERSEVSKQGKRGVLHGSEGERNKMWVFQIARVSKGGKHLSKEFTLERTPLQISISITPGFSELWVPPGWGEGKRMGARMKKSKTLSRRSPANSSRYREQEHRGRSIMIGSY